jgi:hypothetical protein
MATQLLVVPKSMPMMSAETAALRWKPRAPTTRAVLIAFIARNILYKWMRRNYSIVRHVDRMEFGRDPMQTNGAIAIVRGADRRAKRLGRHACEPDRPRIGAHACDGEKRLVGAAI